MASAPSCVAAVCAMCVVNNAKRLDVQYCGKDDRGANNERGINLTVQDSEETAHLRQHSMDIPLL